MRTNIDIDEELLSQAMAATGKTTKKAAVEEALRSVVLAHRRRRALEELSGLGWEGDLEKMRTDWAPFDWGAEPKADPMT